MAALETALCPDCQKDKPLTDFPRNKNRENGRGLYCKPCYAIRYKAHRERKASADGRTLRPERDVPEGCAYCPACEQAKPLDDFGRNRAARNGRAAYCKPCHNAKGKDTYLRLYGGTREYHLRRRYGITGAEYDALVEAQGGLCVLCQERKPEHVDHDHVTGRVRGVLCSCCNQGLGNFRDRADTFRNAIDYLERTTWQRQQVCPGVYRLTSPRPAAARSRSSSELQRLISSRRG